MRAELNVDESTYRHSWQLQMIPALLAIRHFGPGHLTHNQEDDKVIHPPNPTLPPNLTQEPITTPEYRFPLLNQILMTRDEIDDEDQVEIGNMAPPPLNYIAF